MTNAYISGTGSYVPPRVVTNQMLIDEYGIDSTDEWIISRTGIRERRFADEGVGTSDLALKASEQALESAGLSAHDLDMIIVATLSPDHHFPGTGVYLQNKLGLCDGKDAKFVPALDVRNQCSGFLYGLSVANAMVRSGASQHVLVVGAEVHSHAIDLTTRGRGVATLFGDGAGAVVVSATDEERGIRETFLGADGSNADQLAQRVWDISKSPFMPVDEEGRGLIDPEMMWAQMNGKLVFKNSVKRMSEALMHVCLKQGLTRDDIDLFLFHQANLRANEWVQRLLDIPQEKVVHNIDRYANTTAATIPLLMAEAERSGRLKRGMKVACVAFGSGFTWGSAIIDW